MKSLSKILFAAMLSLIAFNLFSQVEYWNDQSSVRYGFQKAVRLKGDITPDTIATSQNNYNPTGFSNSIEMRLIGSAAVNLTGLQGGSDGRLLITTNVSAFNITFKHQSASSEAANRFICPSGGDAILRPGYTFILKYDDFSDRWRIISITNSVQNYKALITQASTAAPSAATTIENTLGYTITWARSNTGIYTATITGYTAGKVFVDCIEPIVSTTPVDVNITSVVSGSDWVITVKTFSNGSLADGVFTACPFEIQIYP